jgi:hypothetical protein
MVEQWVSTMIRVVRVVVVVVVMMELRVAFGADERRWAGKQVVGRRASRQVTRQAVMLNAKCRMLNAMLGALGAGRLEYWLVTAREQGGCAVGSGSCRALAACSY